MNNEKGMTMWMLIVIILIMVIIAIFSVMAITEKGLFAPKAENINVVNTENVIEENAVNEDNTQVVNTEETEAPANVAPTE